MVLTGLVVFAIVVLRGFPETAAAKWLDRTLVRGLRRLTRTHLIFLILLAVILIAGTELLAMAGPFDMALVLMWDVSAYVDIVLTTAVVATATRSGSGWKALIARVIPAKRARSRRRRAVNSVKPSANDDDRPAFALAA